MKYQKRKEEIHALEFRLNDQTLHDLQVFTGEAIFRTGRKRTPAEGPWAYVKTWNEDHSTFVVLEGEYICKRADGTLFPLTKLQLETDYIRL